MIGDALGELTACPECGSPAQLSGRALLDSTDGPVEHARIRCVRKHWFFMPSAHLAH